MALLLTGCLFRPPDELYRRPERSAGYDQLAEAIRSVKTGLEGQFGVGCEDAVIVSGDNTASIQLQDLDGDGQRESAVAFIRVPGVEKSLKIYIFTAVDGDYQVRGLVEGDGSAIYSVDYVDLNGAGSKELVVNWQVNTGVYQLGAYTLDELEPVEDTAVPTQNQAADRASLRATELLLTSCGTAVEGGAYSSGYRLLDIDQDTRTEVALCRLDPGGGPSALEIYGWNDGVLSCRDTAELSARASSIDSMQANYVGGELLTPALYVCSSLAEGGRAVDIVAYQGDRLVDLTMDPESGVSRETLRGSGQQELTDINGDYVLEVPQSTPLPSAADGPTDFWLTRWGQYGLDGQRTVVGTTYHNRTDGWYLDIPEDWVGQLTISRTDRAVGQREVIFSRWKGEGQEPERFLAIYKLTGPNRSAWASTTNRFILQEDDDTIYAATLLNASWDCGVDEAGLRGRFHLIG